jgi:hypothetical protein
VDGKEGTLYIQVTHNKEVRQINTGFKLLKREWNRSRSCVIPYKDDDAKNKILFTLEDGLRILWLSMEKVVDELVEQDIPFTVDDIVAIYERRKGSNTLFNFSEKIIHQLKCLGQVRTSETYTLR